MKAIDTTTPPTPPEPPRELVPVAMDEHPEPRIPEWRRRSLEAGKGERFVAVADIPGGPSL